MIPTLTGLSRGGVRRLGAELAIGLSLCAGAYMLLVDPLERRLTRTREEIGALRSRLSAASLVKVTPEQASMAIAQARGFAREVRRRSAPALSEADMFAALTALAQRHHVRLDLLQPTGAPRQAARSDDQPDRKPLPGDARTGCTLTFMADFTDAAAFLSDLQRDLGYALVRSARLTPTAEPGTRNVTVIAETEHRAFDTSVLEAALAGAEGSHGDAGGDR